MSIWVCAININCLGAISKALHGSNVHLILRLLFHSLEVNNNMKVC